MDSNLKYGAVTDDVEGAGPAQKTVATVSSTKMLLGLFVLGLLGGGVYLIVYFTGGDTASGGGTINLDTLNFTAIGDWGTSPDTEHQSSTQKDNCQWQDHDRWNQACWKDFNAQLNLGYLMGNWADGKNISFVMSHGDNMYWDGVLSSTDPRWNTTFENVYNYSSLAVPWLAVMGNHDYGGGSDYGGSGADSLEKLFQAQKNYKSHVPGREWHLDHYFKKTFTHKTQDGTIVDVDVFNIDTNVAYTHGYDEICCQIYPLKEASWGSCPDAACRSLDTYDPKKGCNTDVSAINSCRTYLEKQFKDSMSQLGTDLAASKATWKIVNSHYHPRMHMPKHEVEINAVLKAGGAHAVFCGHTHAEGHDYNSDSSTHFFLNGAGGGIRLSGDDAPPQDDVKKSFTQYAFIGSHAGKDNMKIVFWGFDLTSGGGWSDWKNAKAGKPLIYHCWNIPQDGSVGKECTKDEIDSLTAEALQKFK